MKTRLDELVSQYVRERRNVLAESGIRIHNPTNDEEIGFIVMKMNEKRIVVGYKPNTEFGKLVDRLTSSETKYESEGFVITYVTPFLLNVIVKQIDRYFTIDLFKIVTNIGDGKIISEYAYVNLYKGRTTFLE